MNYIKHLNLMFSVFDQDKRLGPYHIMIYMALFRQWNREGFSNPIMINRETIMAKAKIKSPKTYSKTLKEMDNWGYLKYEQSTSRIYGSTIYMFPTSVFKEQVVPPFYKHINSKNIYTENETFDQDKNFKKDNQPTNPVRSEFTPPPLQHIKIYFNEKRAPELEAEKFFNHYEARNWLNNSFNPITNWKAAARNWIINIPKFNPRKKLQPKNKTTNDKPGNIKLNQTKNYDTPL
ncbi:hypothetical protein [Marinilabilia rubra]|uniref:Uncharacterized protein n=1 Tax=Marinilabilia rubra TaxID=2162893 RepID=A0A2U2BBZ3_9BACT|nr:hypothetical protein [Marinilabilia rubra]PWE00586.1 hypothetical protein DDZ16_03025 [Marinilabilia rubra]